MRPRRWRPGLLQFTIDVVTNRAVEVPQRIGVLGDVHAEHERLEVSLAFLRRECVDVVLCVGDVLDGYGDEASCIALLTEHQVRTVRGNHERWRLDPAVSSTEPRAARIRDWCASLPTTRTLVTAAGPTLLCHGVGEDDMRLFLPATPVETFPQLGRLRASGIRLMLCGHTHVRMVRNVGGLCVVNAGTFDRRDRPGFAVVDSNAQLVNFYDVGTKCQLANRVPFLA